MAMVVVVVLLVAGTAQGMNVWALYDDSGFTGRLGTELGEAKNVEIGAEWQSCFDWKKPFHGEDYLGGVYGVLKLFDSDALLNPYIGGRILFDYENDADYIGGPLAGLLLGDGLIFEYAYQDWSRDMKRISPDRHKVTVGLRLRF